MNMPAIEFDNRFTRELPADPETGTRRRQIRDACYSRVAPAPVKNPQLVAYSAEVAELLGLSIEACESQAFTDVFTGNAVLPGMDPHATCYGGHQFGNWAGQLGDGRAICLGEAVNADGEHWVLQLKGAGETPYSRTADGLAVLRSSVREFLCSEAMHHLGVPTTRALSLTLTGEQVIRDMLYDGHPAPEPGAVVCRVAPSFTRFGHFEILAARKETELLKRFTDFTIRTDFPELFDAGGDAKSMYRSWFEEVCRRTANMIVEWMRVGFVHGVMNTDNMSILGLTIDYGPYGWLENYDPDWTPNTTDAAGKRYRFAYQPAIAQWNLVRLANAIHPLIGETESLEETLRNFEHAYGGAWQETMARKLGLRGYEPATDAALIDELDEVLQLAETDMTIFFRRLADVDAADPSVDVLGDAYYEAAQLTPSVRARTEAWLSSYGARVRADAMQPTVRRERMNAVNPKYVLRNYMAQLAIDDADQGDFSLVNELLDVLRQPYAEQPEREAWAVKRPDWARARVGCSMLSCSS
ncbi:MAG: YdiU family protein [Gammaproteobacteria bacterium]|nr:YdiU family protein [Gammaproteobacteria bacterium]